MISPFTVLRASTAVLTWGRILSRYERVLRGLLWIYALLCGVLVVLGVAGRPPLGWLGGTVLVAFAAGYATWAMWDDARMESGWMVALGALAGAPMVVIIWWATGKFTEALDASAVNGGDAAALVVFFVVLAFCLTVAIAVANTIMVVSFWTYRAKVRLWERHDDKRTQRRELGSGE